jgi:hypothetical protein
MVDFEHAYNYWRKIFADKSSAWDKSDFDNWFSAGSKLPLSFFESGLKEGSKEHFNQLIKEAFIEMLSACERRDFSK